MNKEMNNLRKMVSKQKSKIHNLEVILSKNPKINQDDF